MQRTVKTAEVAVRLLTHAYVRPDTKAGDIVTVSLELAERLIEMGVAELASEGQRRELAFVNEVLPSQ